MGTAVGGSGGEFLPPPRSFPDRLKPDVLRPAIVRMRGFMVIRLRPCMIMTTPAPSPLPVGKYLVGKTCKAQSDGVRMRTTNNPKTR